MGKRKYAVILSLFLVLVSCSFLSYGLDSANSGPPVSMEVSSIFGETGKMGVHVPVSVRLYGQAAFPFVGTVKVSTLETGAGSEEEIYEYLYPVQVNTAETKELEIYIPLGQKSSRLHVTLLNEEGEVVQEQDMRFEISKDRGHLLLGALTDYEEELQFLDGVSMEYGMVSSRVITMDEESFPSDERGLELFNVLVINDFNTEHLSEDQVSAIWKWIEKGGTLLIGTGFRGEDSLAAFEDQLDITFTGTGYYENINLGMEFTEKAPGDSDVYMYCAEIQAPGTHVVEESDGIPLLMKLDRKDGMVGIYSYDLGELAEFVHKNPTYVNKMMTDVLGEERISQIYYYSSYGSEQEYWNAHSMVNTGSADQLPKMTMYTVVIVVYILIAGPGLYLFLKKRDMSRLYGTSVVVSAVVVSSVIYLLGVGTRFTSQFITVASIMGLDGNKTEETSYLNVRTPDSRPFSLTVPADYTVTPLTKSSRYEEQPVREFERQNKSGVELKFGENGTVISAGKTMAFEPRYFKITRETEDESGGYIYGELQWADGRISGTVINDMSFALEDAVILLYGQLYPIGDLGPGEVLTLDDEPLTVWPVGMSYLVSSEITENADEDSNAINTKGRSSLYSFYMDENYCSYTSECCLLASGPSGGILTASTMNGQHADGTVLYAAKLSVSSGESGLVYRSGLMNKPEVNAGNSTVYGDGLAMYGTDPMVVEYFLGTDIWVEKISLLPVSDEFFDDSRYYYLKQFDGAMYFYNYTTKSYDRMDMSKVDFTAEELRPYLSQKNTLVVKYTAGEDDSAGMSALLPHLMVTGREN